MSDAALRPAMEYGLRRSAETAMMARRVREESRAEPSKRKRRRARKGVPRRER